MSGPQLTLINASYYFTGQIFYSDGDIDIWSDSPRGSAFFFFPSLVFRTSLLDGVISLGSFNNLEERLEVPKRKILMFC